jgi:uncharacterized protein (TIGR02646 family)
MVKRERKDSNGNVISIPFSLQDATANTLRNNLIHGNRWLNQPQYKTQFKQQDTKDALDEMSNTCVFCQQKLTIATGNEDARSIEHFRPKSKYWWLAYSWDNLFPVCIKCNQSKSDDFECLGAPITYIRTGDLANIHSLAADYQGVENPKLLHPELDEPETHLKYDLKGKVENDNSDKGKYTISTCKLNRLDLQGKRKKEFDDFDEKLSLILFDGSKNATQKQNDIFRLFFDFQKEGNDERNEFSGFKKYISTHFLRDIIRGYISLL